MDPSRLRRAIAALVIVGASFAPVVAPTVASAATADFTVTAGGDPGLKPYEFLKYYPTTLNVMPGQVVEWKVFGFHSITFLKDDLASAHPAIFRGDPDGLYGMYAFTEEWAFASACAVTRPCTFEGKQSAFSSGPPVGPSDPFQVQIGTGAAPGLYRYHCVVHPSMHGFLNVVDEASKLKTQEQIDAATEVEVEADIAKADAVVKQLSTPKSVAGPGGTRIHTVHVGASTDDHSVAILGYLPSSLQVRAGDEVAFVFGRDGTPSDPTKDELHSVTFPLQAVGSGNVMGAPIPVGFTGLGIQPACDPDGREEGAPSVPGVLPPACPANPEVVAARFMTTERRATGNAVATPLTEHDSSIMAPAAAPAWANVYPATTDRLLGQPVLQRPMPTTFSAQFPNTGTFAYGCTIHGNGMSGSITVG